LGGETLFTPPGRLPSCLGSQIGKQDRGLLPNPSRFLWCRKGRPLRPGLDSLLFRFSEKIFYVFNLGLLRPQLGWMRLSLLYAFLNLAKRAIEFTRRSLSFSRTPPLESLIIPTFCCLSFLSFPRVLPSDSQPFPAFFPELTVIFLTPRGHPPPLPLPAILGFGGGASRSKSFS